MEEEKSVEVKKKEVKKVAKKKEFDPNKKGILRAIGQAIVKGAILGYCKIVYRLKIYGKENVPKDGALIFCGNHRTYLDPPLIVVTAGRDMRFIAKEELKKNPFFRFLGFLFNCITVKRDAKDIGPLKESLKTLKAGGCIGIFPEGTRNGFEKNGGEMKNGTAYMALKTGATIIPIGIVGQAKPFTKNAIIYGKPMDLSEFQNRKTDKDDELKVSEMLKEEILTLAAKNI